MYSSILSIHNSLPQQYARRLSGVKLRGIALPCFKLAIFTLACTLFGLAGKVYADGVFDPGLAAFTVKVNNIELQYHTAFRAVLPGERLQLKLSSAAEDYQLQQGDDPLVAKKQQLNWRAPMTPGYYPISITRRADNARVLLQVLVMQPASKVVDGKLNGYRIDRYPRPLRGLNSYRAPTGYIEVFPELKQLAISPHFTLGQFLCKQASGYPKYLVLRPRLLNKLELLLADLNQQGIRTDSLTVMSGYRTPYYNRAIGNVPNSRHVFGGAADVFVDVNPVDYFMDDINGDGAADVKDAEHLYLLAEKVVGKSGRVDLVGGIGKYKKNAAHGPFVHLDVRGTRARWGH